MGRASRDKGNRAERAIVKSLINAGLTAERVPLSGSAGGSYVGDLMVRVADRNFVVEVKARKNGFRQLYDWLDARDVLVLRADRATPLVVLRMDLAAEIALAADKNQLRIERVIVRPGGVT
ncbi:hypothetical protein [Bradyrhizobium sp. OAE829]|uniref:putative PDDEXK endonuclease n=1 Tax=Bradyrhizobium sp. OAE829 TaxID=2663807 RepID=UPI001A06F780